MAVDAVCIKVGENFQGFKKILKPVGGVCVIDLNV